MKSLSDMPLENVTRVKALLFDLDGTFVSSGFIGSKAYKGLENLHKSNPSKLSIISDSSLFGYKELEKSALGVLD